MTAIHIENNHANGKYGAPVMISKTENEFYHCAKMYHLTQKELYFESHFAPSPGSDVNIRMGDCRSDLSNRDACGNFHGKVTWCREELDGYTFNYKVGVQIFQA